MTHLQLQGFRALVADKAPPAGSRTWGENRCAHCCNGDRCDDPTHYDRSKCPHCLGTGYALWLPEFQPMTPPPTESTIATEINAARNEIETWPKWMQDAARASAVAVQPTEGEQ